MGIWILLDSEIFKKYPDPDCSISNDWFIIHNPDTQHSWQVSFLCAFFIINYPRYYTLVKSERKKSHALRKIIHPDPDYELSKGRIRIAIFFITIDPNHCYFKFQIIIHNSSYLKETEQLVQADLLASRGLIQGYIYIRVPKYDNNS